MPKLPPGLPGLKHGKEIPCCRLCGGLLRPQVEHRIETVDEPFEAVSGSSDADGLYVVRGFRRRTIKIPVKVTGYGYQGNGFFCSLTCGYLYALRQLKEF